MIDEFRMIDKFPEELPDKHIVVFGSNTEGWHGSGLARDCKRLYGAEQHYGVGRQGQCYAIPTRERDPNKPAPALQTMSLDKIYEYVQDFIQYAKDHKELTFLVSPIGCGHAGYSPKQIALMFKNARYDWIKLPVEFNEILNDYQETIGNPEAQYEF